MSFKGFGGENIFTDAVKDAIGNDLILDQFDISYAASFYGGTSDDYVTGSILTRQKNPYGGDSKFYYTLTTGSRGRVFRKSEADIQPYTDVPWGLKVNRSYRISQLFDSEEKFYDSNKNLQKYPDKHFEIAKLWLPADTAIDKEGNFYITEEGNYCVRKVTSTGIVSILAGNPSASGYADGAGTSARFATPEGIAIDKNKNIYVADSVNNCIRKITPEGLVSTFAGATTSGFFDGNGSSARFNFPYGITYDEFKDALYVTDRGNFRIRQITMTADVTTIAGNGSTGFVDGDALLTAQFDDLGFIAVDKKSIIYFVDQGNCSIRKLVRNSETTGIVSTIAGNGTFGWVDGLSTNARFGFAVGICVDNLGNLYVTDSGRIRKITNDGVVTTIAGRNFGGNNSSFFYGKLNDCIFRGPLGIDCDLNNNLYLVDQYAHCVLKINLSQENAIVIAGDPAKLGFFDTQFTENRYPYGTIPSPITELLGSKVLFRRDRYGQNRDMLEQRVYSKFVKTNISPVENDAIVPSDFKKVLGDKLGSLAAAAPTPSPVSVIFVKQKYEVDGRGIGRIFSEIVSPLSGTSQNLSIEAVSADAFYDNISLQR